MELHQREGYVSIRDDAGRPLYHERAEDFERDARARLPKLPAGMVEYMERAGVLIYYDAKGNAFPKEGNGAAARCPFAKRVLSRVPAILAARDARLKAAKKRARR